MLTLHEAVCALYGALRLARYDAGGMAYFDTSASGAVRSFYAAALVAPLYLLVLVSRLLTTELAMNPARFFAVEAIAYVIHWVAFPLVMVSVCRIIDRTPQYLGYIVASNWTSAVQNAVFLPLTMVALAVPGIANLVGALALGVILAYDWFTTRTALRLSGLNAVPIVVLGLILNWLIEAASESLL